MIFKEHDVDASQYQGLSFKEVSIQLVRGSGKEDWFDHKRYIKETLPKLLSIKPPAQMQFKPRQEKKPI
jgi:hypothetical protein